MLHGFGFSVEYNRLLKVEAQIEQSVLQCMEQNDGVYLPPDIVLGRHVFFAIDSIDFAEDTHDGQQTFHGAAMATRKSPKMQLLINNSQFVCVIKIGYKLNVQRQVFLAMRFFSKTYYC